MNGRSTIRPKIPPYSRPKMKSTDPPTKERKVQVFRDNKQIGRTPEIAADRQLTAAEKVRKEVRSNATGGTAKLGVTAPGCDWMSHLTQPSKFTSCQKPKANKPFTPTTAIRPHKDVKQQIGNNTSKAKPAMQPATGTQADKRHDTQQAPKDTQLQSETKRPSIRKTPAPVATKGQEKQSTVQPPTKSPRRQTRSRQEQQLSVSSRTKTTTEHEQPRACTEVDTEAIQAIETKIDNILDLINNKILADLEELRKL